jgi:uncharacterized membrane protein YqiK
VLNIEQKQAVEIADEDRTIALSAKKSERIDADRLVGKPKSPPSSTSRKATSNASRRWTRRGSKGGASIEQLEIARVQALQEAEIASRTRRSSAPASPPIAASTRRASGASAICASSRSTARSGRDGADGEGDRALSEVAGAIGRAGRSGERQSARHRGAERVITVRDSEVAKRRRSVEVLIAEKEAEETRIAAEAERVRAAVEAEAQRLLNEAENVLTEPARYSLFRRKLLDRIEGIVRESVKPMEKIEGIRILQVDGLNGGHAGGNGGRSATDEVIDSALRYRVQAPLIDSILADIGVEGGSLAKMPGLMREARDMQGIRKDVAPKGEPDGAPPGERSRVAAKEELRASMARVFVSSVVNGRNDRVWARVRDFNGLPNWHPAIAESRIEGGEPSDKVGCVRDFRLRNGDRIREKLLGLSDYDMFCTYSILESPMGVENYVATLRLTPVTDGERTFAEWTAEFDCAPEREAELIANIGGGVFQGGFDALKRAFGG